MRYIPEGGALAGTTTIYFDLDGTLTDPKPGITQTQKPDAMAGPLNMSLTITDAASLSYGQRGISKTTRAFLVR